MTRISQKSRSYIEMLWHIHINGLLPKVYGALCILWITQVYFGGVKTRFVIHYNTLYVYASSIWQLNVCMVSFLKHNENSLQVIIISMENFPSNNKKKMFHIHPSDHIAISKNISYCYKKLKLMWFVTCYFKAKL